MLTILKLVAAVAIGLGILNPFSSETCECKAKAGTKVPAPKVDSCTCKANA